MFNRPQATTESLISQSVGGGRSFRRNRLGPLPARKTQHFFPSLCRSSAEEGRTQNKTLQPHREGAPRPDPLPPLLEEDSVSGKLQVQQPTGHVLDHGWWTAQEAQRPAGVHASPQLLHRDPATWRGGGSITDTATGAPPSFPQAPPSHEAPRM